MPLLDVNGPLPIVAVAAAMGYPSDTKDGAQKRDAFYRYGLNGYARYLVAQGVTELSPILATALNDPVPKPRTESRRLVAGPIMGDLFKAYKGLINSDPDKASWYNAIATCRPLFRAAGLPHSDSYLWGIISEFKPSAHLWAAQSLRSWRYVPGPGSSFTVLEDLDCFLQEAEILRSWGENWSKPYDKFEPPLNCDCWRVPPDWKPRRPRSGWPKNAGKMPLYRLEPTIITSIRSKGRPRKAL